MDRLGGAIFKVFEVVTLELGSKNRPKSLAWKRSHLKNTSKNISLGYISQETLLFPPTHFWSQWVFFSFSKILKAQFPKRHNTKKKKNFIKCAIATYKHFKQNLQCTNNANIVRKIPLKKVLVTELDPPKDFKKSTRLVATNPPIGYTLWRNATRIMKI